MNTTARQSIEHIEHIERLLHLSAELSDAGRYKELADLFTEDGVFVRPSAPETPITGRTAILQSLFDRPLQAGRRHVVAAPFVKIHDTYTASAHSVSILIVSNGDGSGVVSVGGFRDTLVCINGQWKFARRAGYALFSPAPYPPAAPAFSF